MQRKAKAAIIGSIAGTAMVTGVWFAFPASAHETNAQSQAGNPCPSGNSTNARQQGRNKGCAGSGVAPSGSGAPTGSSTAAPTQSATTAPTQSATATATANPTSSSSTSSCTTATGSASTIVSPGVGTVTVTIKVCNGVLSTSTGVISQSNWNANTAALASLNTLAVQYYASDMSKITYSGATLTSNAYQSSLESALSNAGL